MEDKKKYVKPDANVVDFVDEDIITLSLGTQNGDWTEDDNGENM